MKIHSTLLQVILEIPKKLFQLCKKQANRGAAIVVMAAGGKLAEIARKEHYLAV
jgi:hypothetical protein